MGGSGGREGRKKEINGEWGEREKSFRVYLKVIGNFSEGQII